MTTEQGRRDRRAWVERYRRRLPVMQKQSRQLRLPDRVGRSMAGRIAGLAARKGLSHISELAGCDLYGIRNVGVKTIALIEALWPVGSSGPLVEPPIGRVH